MTIKKIEAGSITNSTVRQLWIGDTAEEFEEAIRSYNICYPEMGYGTHFEPVKACDSVPGVVRYAGKFFTVMNRLSSCD